MTKDREELRAWYREAMSRRAEELRTLRERLAMGDAAALADARAVGQALRGSGATFGDGVEALDLLRGGPEVSLVVADLNMPEMDGLEPIWEMRGDAGLAHIPVIVLTGETDEVLETKLIDEGADDYVCKPLDPRLFLARVGATIRRADG